MAQVVFVVCFSTITPAFAEVKKPKKIVFGIGTPTVGFKSIYFDKLYKEAFRRMGIKFKLKLLPAARASMEADKGQTDGDPYRIYSYADIHPNLIRIEESPFSIKFSAFGLATSKIKLKGWKSLKGANYRVNYQRGTKGTATELKKVVKSDLLEVVDRDYHALKKICAGRTDLFVGVESKTVEIIKKKGKIMSS